MFGDTGNTLHWGPMWDRLSLLRAIPPVTFDETSRGRAWVSFTEHRKLPSPVRVQETLQVGDRVLYLVGHIAAWFVRAHSTGHRDECVLWENRLSESFRGAGSKTPSSRLLIPLTLTSCLSNSPHLSAQDLCSSSHASVVQVAMVTTLVQRTTARKCLHHVTVEFDYKHFQSAAG